jgi:hypothetical protein
MNRTDERHLDRTLWAAQWILACAFEFIGMVKLGLTVDQARPLFGLEADATTRMLHTVGAVEVVIALAVILPGVTGIVPQLCTVAAASLGAVALLGLFRPATAAYEGIAGVNLVLVALAAFVVWGRLAKVPIDLFSGEDPDAQANDEQVLQCGPDHRGLDISGCPRFATERGPIRRSVDNPVRAYEVTPTVAFSAIGAGDSAFIAGSNRRQSPRQRRRLKVTVEGSHAFTGDVACGGFCAELMRVFQPGTTVNGTITVAGKDFEYVGRVSWARPGDARILPTGRVGIRFLRIPPEFAGLLAGSFAERLM